MNEKKNIFSLNIIFFEILCNLIEYLSSYYMYSRQFIIVNCTFLIFSESYKTSFTMNQDEIDIELELMACRANPDADTEALRRAVYGSQKRKSKEKDGSPVLGEGNDSKDTNKRNIDPTSVSINVSEAANGIHSKVMYTSEPSSDTSTDQVAAKLRKIALASMNTQSLAQGSGNSTITRELAQTNTDHLHIEQGGTLPSPPPIEYANGFIPRMKKLPEKALFAKNKIQKEIANPSTQKTNTFAGAQKVKPRDKRLRPQTSKIALTADGEGWFSSREVPDLLDVSAFPDFGVSLNLTSHAVSTNCVDGKKQLGGLPQSANISFTCSLKPKDHSLTSHDGIRLRKDRPALMVLSDQSFPEVVEDSQGVFAAITRVEDATFDSLRTVLKATLPLTKTSVLPKGSLILVCTPVELLRLDVSAFLFQFDQFERWLAVRMCTGKDPDENDFVKGNVTEAELTIIPIFPPVNDEVLIERIAQINHNTRAKLTTFPNSHTKLVKYHLLLDASKICEKVGVQQRTVELGPLPVFPPNTSLTKGTAVTRTEQIKIPTNQPYTMNSDQRSPLFVPELLRLIRLIRPDISLPSSSGLNQSQVLIKKPPKGAKVATSMQTSFQEPVCTPRGGFTDAGRVIVVGQSTAGMLAHHLKNTLYINSVTYHKSRAPLTNDKVEKLIAFLTGLNLSKKDCVILDLTCNFAPKVSQDTEDKVPLSTGGQRGRVYHLFDSEGKKLCIPDPASIDSLIEKVAVVTESMVCSNNLVINLSPLPRYQTKCCGDTSHGIQKQESPGSLNSLLRDVGIFMGRTKKLSLSPMRHFTISPMDIYGNKAFLAPRICKDNVHPTSDYLSLLACAILIVRREGQKCRFPEVPSPLSASLTFSSWYSHQLRNRGIGGAADPDASFRPKTLAAPHASNAPIGWGYQFK